MNILRTIRENSISFFNGNNSHLKEAKKKNIFTKDHYDIDDCNHLTLLKLPSEFLSQFCTCLPLNMMARFAQVSIKASKMSEENFIWKQIAEKINVPVVDGIFKSQKLQVKEALIQEVSYGTIDLVNNKLLLRNDSNELFRDALEMFEQYVPKDYFFKQYLGFGTFRLIYRDENGETKQLFSMGRIKSVWNPQEKEEWDRIQSTMKEFKIGENLSRPL